MDSSGLLEAVIAGTREFSRSMAAEVHELDGVTAAVVPACPERSVLNSVCYEREESLAPRLDELAAIYDAAGVRAWTVWVRPSDRDAAAALEAAGHVLDAAPEAMAMSIESFERPPCPYEWTREGDPLVVAALNDRAYGYDGSFERALAGFHADGACAYVASLEGRPVSCCLTLAEGEDCHMTLVATVHEARGRGLAGALMGQALADGRERGLRSSSLVATKMGRPVYDRLGYRALGPVEMWERRRT
jgi:GNAT superfamily N-acetyltransferase